MATAIKVWCLLIDRERRPIGAPISLSVSSEDNVDDLRQKAAKMLPELRLSIIWRCRATLRADADISQLEELIEAVDFSDRQKAVALPSVKKVRSLGLEENEILLVQIPLQLPPPPTPMATTSKVWCLLINHERKRIGSSFLLDVSPEDNILVLRQKVKDCRPRGTIGVDSAELVVWKCNEPKLHVGTTITQLEELIKAVDFYDSQKAVELTSETNVMDLGLEEKEILLVQIPVQLTALAGEYESLPRSALIQEYQDTFIRVGTLGVFEEEDLRLNNLVSTPGDSPAAVDFKNMLLRKPGLDDDACTSALVAKLDDSSKAVYVWTPMEGAPVDEPSSKGEPWRRAGWLEMTHTINLASFEWQKVWDSTFGERLKECEAKALLFYKLMFHVSSLPSEHRITAQLGNHSWKFSLILEDDNRNELRKYNPRSDFLISKCALPRLLVEVNLTPSLNALAPDAIRMLLQGVAIVRFANTFLDLYKEEKDFVLPAIFIRGDGRVDRYILFQQKGSQEVRYTKETFTLSDSASRTQVALQLYNLSHALGKEREREGEGDVDVKLDQFKKSVENHKRKYGLKTLYSKKPQTGPGPSDSAGAGDSADAGAGGSGGAGASIHDQLRVHGYELVPDTFEDESGIWEVLDKLPPHILTVYRMTDPRKTELIAKVVRERSNELKILQELRNIQPQSLHVISLIESIHMASGSLAILPKLHSIQNQLELYGGRRIRGKVAQLCWDLIEGLAYLHEHHVAHMDIKPDNLVYDDAFRLQIVDFDVAIQVPDENAVTEGYRGTKGWTAPEVGKENGPVSRYRPIFADRWSCGRVIEYLLKMDEQDQRLLIVAQHLKADEPDRRPSLLGRHKWLTTPLSDLANVLKGGEKGVTRTWKDVMEADGEDMKPPKAKKPKLTVP